MNDAQIEKLIIYTHDNIYGGIQQVDSEWLSFLKFLDEKKIDTAIEIGSAWGGSSYCLAHFVKHLITIDKIQIPRSTQKLIKRTCMHHHVTDNSNNCIDLVGKLCNGKADMIFIDADHSYQGAKQDFFRYFVFTKNSASPIIALHDIKETDYHKKNGCFVHNFWYELCNMGYKNFEIIDDDPGVNWGGLGVILL